jgi:hypothetical protein
MPDLEVCIGGIDAFLDRPETVAHVKAEIQQPMKQVSGERPGVGFVRLILYKEHDVHIGGKAEFFSTVTAQGNDRDKLLPGI